MDREGGCDAQFYGNRGIDKGKFDDEIVDGAMKGRDVKLRGIFVQVGVDVAVFRENGVKHQLWCHCQGKERQQSRSQKGSYRLIRNDVAK